MTLLATIHEPAVWLFLGLFLLAIVILAIFRP